MHLGGGQVAIEPQPPRYRWMPPKAWDAYLKAHYPADMVPKMVKSRHPLLSMIRRDTPDVYVAPVTYGG